MKQHRGKSFVRSQPKTFSSSSESQSSLSFENKRGDMFSTPVREEAEKENPIDIMDSDEVCAKEVRKLTPYELTFSKSGLETCGEGADFGDEEAVESAAQKMNRLTRVDGANPLAKLPLLSEELMRQAVGGAQGQNKHHFSYPAVTFPNYPTFLQWAEDNKLNPKTVENISTQISNKDSVPIVISPTTFFQAVKCGETHDKIAQETMSLIQSNSISASTVSALIPTLEALVEMRPHFERLVNNSNAKAHMFAQMRTMLHTLQPFIFLTKGGQFVNLPMDWLNTIPDLDMGQISYDMDGCSDLEQQSELLYSAINDEIVERRRTAKEKLTK
ncbi:phosphoprotein [Potato cyst nematode rhabdovirus]|nr:phosphoprotein [Potato cyst nematode rhabdovirus]DAZ92282.1 TPA_asm: phosphoprotein [Potato cyst nematode rhabdovirus]